MTSRLVREILREPNSFEKIPITLSPIKIKMIAAVLTQKGVGTVLCPKCNVLNIVRDGNFQCHCGFASSIVDCACGMCGEQLLDKNRQGKTLKFLMGHGGVNRDGSKRDGYFTNKYGYVMVLMATHHRANSEGYVREHILVYEKHHECYILPWANVHHINEVKSDNRPENLELMSRSRHSKIHHPRTNPGQICIRCGGFDVIKNGVSDGRQTFKCRTCKKCWIINNKKVAKYLERTCPRCGSRSVCKKGFYRGERYMKCTDCSRTFSDHSKVLNIGYAIERRHEQHSGMVFS